MMPSTFRYETIAVAPMALRYICIGAAACVAAETWEERSCSSFVEKDDGATFNTWGELCPRSPCSLTV